MKSATPFVSEIFWPSSLLECRTRAFLVGWNTDNFNCCVVGAVPLHPERSLDTGRVNAGIRGTDFEIRDNGAFSSPTHDGVADEGALGSDAALFGLYDDVCAALTASSSSFPSSSEPGLAGREGAAQHMAAPVPVVLGMWIPSSEAASDPIALLTPPVRFQSLSIWITLTNSNGDSSGRNNSDTFGDAPRLSSLFSCGLRYESYCYMLRYDGIDPRSHNYFSVQLPRHFGYNLTALRHAAQNYEVAGARRAGVQSDLEVFVRLANEAPWLMHRLLLRLGRTSQHDDSAAFRDDRHSIHLHRLVRGMVYLSRFLFRLCRVVDAVIAAGAASVPFAAQRGEAVVSRSHTLGLVRKRCNALMASVQAYYELIREDRVAPLESQNQWVFTWNYICSVAFDVALGLALSYALSVYRAETEMIISQWANQIHSSLLSVLEWFQQSPCGLKLNPRLTDRLTSVVGAGIHTFKHFLSAYSAHYPRLLIILTKLGAFGLSIQFAVIADAIQVSTLSIRVFQQIFSLAHRVQVSLLTTLWHLFTGRKINILRKRVDTGHFSQSQMVVGTIYFSIVFFLLPTFVVYYSALTVAQLAVIATVSCLLLGIKVVESFPIFHLALIYKYPLSFIHGISFTVDPSNTLRSLRRTRVVPVSAASSSAAAAPGAASSSGGSASYAPSKRRVLASAVESRIDAQRRDDEVDPSEVAASVESPPMAPPILGASQRPGILKGSNGRRMEAIGAPSSRSKFLKFADEISGYRSTSGDEDVLRPRPPLHPPSSSPLAFPLHGHSYDEWDEHVRGGIGGRSNQSTNSAASDKVVNGEAEDDLMDVPMQPYRPLDDYAFNSDPTEGTSAADEGDEGTPRSPIYSSYGLSSRGHGGYRLGSASSSDRQSRGERRAKAWGVGAALSDRGVKGRLDASGPSSESIYMNIVPNKNSAIKILFNFVALWNNSRTRSALRHLIQQVSIGVVRGTIGLNVPSLVRLWMLVEPTENEDTSTRKPRSDALRRYQEEISGPVRMFPPGGDALIDYMDLRRQQSGDDDDATEQSKDTSESPVEISSDEKREDPKRFYYESAAPLVEVQSASSAGDMLYDKLLSGQGLELVRSGSRPLLVDRTRLLVALMCTHTVVLLSICIASCSIVASFF